MLRVERENERATDGKVVCILYNLPSHDIGTDSP